MLTDRAEDASIAKRCENAQTLAQVHVRCACFTVSVCLNYSTSFRNDDFSSFKNYTKDGQDCG